MRAVCLDANIFQHLVRTYDVVCFISVRGHSEGSPPPRHGISKYVRHIAQMTQQSKWALIDRGGKWSS